MFTVASKSPFSVHGLPQNCRSEKPLHIWVKLTRYREENKVCGVALTVENETILSDFFCIYKHVLERELFLVNAF